MKCLPEEKFLGYSVKSGIFIHSPDAESFRFIWNSFFFMALFKANFQVRTICHLSKKNCIIFTKMLFVTKKRKRKIEVTACRLPVGNEHCRLFFPNCSLLACCGFKGPTTSYKLASWKEKVEATSLMVTDRHGFIDLGYGNSSFYYCYSK